MTTLQEAEMTRRRWEMSINHGSSNEIGEVDRALLPLQSVIAILSNINRHL